MSSLKVSIPRRRVRRVAADAAWPTRSSVLERASLIPALNIVCVYPLYATKLNIYFIGYGNNGITIAPLPIALGISTHVYFYGNVTLPYTRIHHGPRAVDASE